MSIINYNGVTLPYGFTTRFAQDGVYDEIGGTDWVYIKFDIQVQTVINVEYISMIDPELADNPDVTSPAEIMRRIRNKLLQPRRRLSMQFNGVELIPRTGVIATNPEAEKITAEDVDAKNGPQPQSCTLTQLTNATFLMTYHIIAHYWERQTSTLTTSGGSRPPPEQQQPTGNAVLFNRWTETIDIDNANFSTRTRDGKFVIRSDNDTGVIADQLRGQLAVVGVPDGFLRKSSHYTVSPDGLGIQYRVVDQEVFKLPPTPAFEADGEYIETLTNLGAFRVAEVRVRLKGDKDAIRPQSELLKTALGVACSKLAINGAPILGISQIPLGQGAGILQGGHVMVNMYQNVVEVRMRALKTLKLADGPSPSPERLTGIAGLRLEGKPPYIPPITYTPGSEQGQAVTPPYKDRGSANRMLRAAAYFDPALRDTFLDRDLGQNTQGLDIGTGGT